MVDTTEDEQSEYEDEQSSGELDAAGYAAQIKDAAAQKDYETLFGLLADGVASCGAGELDGELHSAQAWYEIETLFYEDAGQFVGWFDWCNNEAVQALLNTSRTISKGIVDFRYGTDQYQRHGEYRDAEWSGKDPRDFAQDAVAYLQADDLPGFMAYLDSLGWSDANTALDAIGRDRWQASLLDNAAQSNPDAFLAALNSASDDVKASLRRRPVIDALVQVRRRAERWTPTSEQLGFVSGSNQVAIKNLPDGGTTTWVAGGFVVLIGDDHEADVVEHVNAESDRASGVVTVRKGTRIPPSAGSLTFTGCPPNKRELIKSAVAGFSDKTVKFV